MKYFIITYGCQMNKSDSERIAGTLEKKGYKQAQEKESADLIVINMCSVRQSAVDRIFGQKKNFAKLKAKNPKLKIILTGCILKRDKKKFREIFDSVENKEKYTCCPPRYLYKDTAFIPISNGCNNFCTYCVVPYARGPLMCHDHKKILKEAKNAIKKGFKEIWLLGQNVNDYNSPSCSSIDFPKLLELVNKIPGTFQIRFTSPNPKNFSDKLIDVMTSSKKVAKYLNLPVQSGDNKILRAMNRPYTVKKYKDLVKKIRRKMPDINLSTDVIVGFPGETKSQFENTVKLFKEIRFNIAYIARFSLRPGTAATKLKDNVPLKEKERRRKILNNIIEKCRPKNSLPF